MPHENENCDLEFDLLSTLWDLIENINEQIADQAVALDDLHFSFEQCKELQVEVPISCDPLLDQAEEALTKFNELEKERDSLLEQAADAQDRVEKCIEHLKESPNHDG